MLITKEGIVRICDCQLVSSPPAPLRRRGSNAAFLWHFEDAEKRKECFDFLDYSFQHEHGFSSVQGPTQALASTHDRDCDHLQRTSQKTIFILRSMRQPVKYL
jgi:hypothetical protein